MIEKKDQETPEDFEELLRAYLTICNQAMSKHAGEFPYKEIWAAAMASRKGDTMRLAVVDDRPKACVSVNTNGQKLEVAPSAADDNHDWVLNYSYLAQVIENAEDYLDDPARLDWSWLMMRRE